MMLKKPFTATMVPTLGEDTCPLAAVQCRLTSLRLQSAATLSGLYTGRCKAFREAQREQRAAGGIGVSYT